MQPDKQILESILSDRLKKPVGLDLSKICFKEQLSFIDDQSDWVTASCSRRAGKTEVCALDLINTAVMNDDVVCLYITTTRINAERIVWAKLLKINKQFELGGEPNISKLSLTFPNGSVIYLLGCKDKTALDNVLGLAVKLVYIDEVQKMRAFIKELIDDAIGPTLMDHGGKLKLIGTPAPIKSGYFWETLNNKQYSHHSWTFFQNPYIAKKSGKTHQEVLDRELKRRGVSVLDPSVRREWFGEWLNDTDSLVFKYDEKINDYNELPLLTDYVLGVDLGSNRNDRDKDAIAVLGWHKNHPECYLVEEMLGSEEGITPLVALIERAIKKYNPVKVVMDTGGLGAKIADELRKRYSIPIVAAEKVRKIEFIAITNDGLRTGRLKAKVTSLFACDSQLVEWDYDKSTQDKLVVSDEFHSDMCDALLYAYREALHWLSQPEPVKVDMRDRSQWLKHTQQLMEDQLQKQINHEASQEREADFWAMQDSSDIFNDNPMQHYLNRKKAGS